ncbi:uncharacterized protein VP01_5743g1 [Puccinia sorghi]|uniref:Uncharacterized protein n=1 Tax=Puccinia sorghi TaxID=27349 RepID=A0A0L6UKM4_9BASI|nr:uncharacterized protein VP01_5743g1 [Puccinia sorghi]
MSWGVRKPATWTPLQICCATKTSPVNRDPLFAEQDPLREARELEEGCVHPMILFFVSSSLVPVSAGQPSPPCEIWTDAEIANPIHRAGPADQDNTALMDSTLSPASRLCGKKYCLSR